LNFIEMYFGVSPDGGDGSFEIMALVLMVAPWRPDWVAFAERPQTQRRRFEVIQGG
jgi:hypothetical protein